MNTENQNNQPKQDAEHIPERLRIELSEKYKNYSQEERKEALRIIGKYLIEPRMKESKNRREVQLMNLKKEILESMEPQKPETETNIAEIDLNNLKIDERTESTLTELIDATKARYPAEFPFGEKDPEDKLDFVGPNAFDIRKVAFDPKVVELMHRMASDKGGRNLAFALSDVEQTFQNMGITYGPGKFVIKTPESTEPITNPVEEVTADKSEEERLSAVRQQLNGSGERKIEVQADSINDLGELRSVRQSRHNLASKLRTERADQQILSAESFKKARLAQEAGEPESVVSQYQKEGEKYWEATKQAQRLEEEQEEAIRLIDEKIKQINNPQQEKPKEDAHVVAEENIPSVVQPTSPEIVPSKNPGTFETDQRSGFFNSVFKNFGPFAIPKKPALAGGEEIPAPTIETSTEAPINPVTDTPIPVQANRVETIPPTQSQTAHNAIVDVFSGRDIGTTQEESEVNPDLVADVIPTEIVPEEPSTETETRESPETNEDLEPLSIEEPLHHGITSTALRQWTMMALDIEGTNPIERLNIILEAVRNELQDLDNQARTFLSRKYSEPEIQKHSGSPIKFVDADMEYFDDLRYIEDKIVDQITRRTSKTPLQRSGHWLKKTASNTKEGIVSRIGRFLKIGRYAFETRDYRELRKSAGKAYRRSPSTPTPAPIPPPPPAPVPEEAPKDSENNNESDEIAGRLENVIDDTGDVTVDLGLENESEPTLETAPVPAEAPSTSASPETAIRTPSIEEIDGYLTKGFTDFYNKGKYAELFQSLDRQNEHTRQLIGEMHDAFEVLQPTTLEFQNTLSDDILTITTVPGSRYEMKPLMSDYYKGQLEVETKRYLNGLAFDNPKAFLEFSETAKEYKRLPEIIREKEKVIKEFQRKEKEADTVIDPQTQLEQTQAKIESVNEEISIKEKSQKALALYESLQPTTANQWISSLWKKLSPEQKAAIAQSRELIQREGDEVSGEEAFKKATEKIKADLKALTEKQKDLNSEKEHQQKAGEEMQTLTEARKQLGQVRGQYISTSFEPYRKIHEALTQKLESYFTIANTGFYNNRRSSFENLADLQTYYVGLSQRISENGTANILENVRDVNTLLKRAADIEIEILVQNHLYKDQDYKAFKASFADLIKIESFAGMTPKATKEYKVKLLGEQMPKYRGHQQDIWLKMLIDDIRSSK